MISKRIRYGLKRMDLTDFIPFLVLVLCTIHKTSLKEVKARKVQLCPPLCELPAVGRKYCQEISLIFSCTSTDRIKQKRRLETQFRCGCLWLETLKNYQSNQHVRDTNTFQNCEKVSSLSCDRYHEIQTARFSGSEIRLGKIVIDINDPRWIHKFSALIIKLNSKVDRLKDPRKRKQAKFTLSRKISEAIIMARKNTTKPAVIDYENKGRKTGQHNLNIMHGMRYFVLHNQTGHYITMEKHVFNLRDPNWLQQFTSYIIKLRRAIENLNFKKDRRRAIKALEENIKLFIMAIEKERNEDSKNQTTSINFSNKMVDKSRFRNNTTQTKQNKSKKKEPGDGKIVESKLPTHKNKTNAIASLKGKNELKMLRCKNCTVVSKTYSSSMGHINTNKSRPLQVKKKKRKIVKPKKTSTKNKDNGWIAKVTKVQRDSKEMFTLNGFKGAEMVTVKDGWVKMLNMRHQDGNFLTVLHRRQKYILMFGGGIFGLLFIIICLLCVKERSGEKNIHSIDTEGDLDLMMKQRKRTTCWEKFLEKLRKSKNEKMNAKEQKIIYPEFFVTRTKVQEGNRKPDISLSGENNNRRKTGNSSKTSSSNHKVIQSESENADEEFKIFHSALMKSYGTEIGKNDLHAPE